MEHVNKYWVVCLLAITLSSCGSSTSEPAATEEHHDEEESIVEFSKAQMATAGISLGKVEQKQISGTIRVSGVLDVPPQQKVSISIPFGGFLKSTPLLQGTWVHAGQLIAVMENPDYIQLQQDYLEEKSHLEFALADYERQQQLANENVNAQKTLQQAKSTYQSSLARKNGLQAKLKMLNMNMTKLESGDLTSTANVYAPIHGYVTQVNVNVGKFVNPTDILFEIVDTQHLHAELIIFEKDVPKIKIGQTVRFMLANESTERTAKVHLIGREIGQDRTIRIHCHIDKEDKDLLPGMYLKAVVEAGGALVSALPDEAIVDFQGKKYIFIPIAEEDEPEHAGAKEGGAAQGGAEQKEGESEPEGQHFKMVELQVGNSELGYTEVFLPEGWSHESEVVVKGAYSVLSKIKNSEEEGGHAH